jgi:hypothetical protein
VSFGGIVQLVRAFVVRPRNKATQNEFTEQDEPEEEPEDQVRQLKIRVISWNMHDSLPKVDSLGYGAQVLRILQGNLAELLGWVPPYHPPPPTDEPVFPTFSADPDHPYHLIVVYVA